MLQALLGSLMLGPYLLLPYRVVSAMVEDYEEGFAALRAVIDQREKAECSSFSRDLTHGVTVRAMSCYSPQDSQERGSHLFSYRCVREQCREVKIGS